MDKPKITFTYHQIFALLLVLFAVAMSALVSRTVFERLPHLEDEMAYLFQAKVFARGDVVIDSPPTRQAFWQPFVVDYQATGKRFSKYTPGWSALLAVGIVLGQGWVINAFLGGMTVALVYRLGREVFNPDVGLIAAALVSFSPMALLLNATLMGHTAALFFTTLFIYAYWRMERKGVQHPVRWGALAGFALGMVVINRPLTAIGIVVPFVVWSAARVAWGFFGYFRVGAHGRAPLQILTPLIVLAVVAGIISAAIPVYNYAATGQPTKNLYTLVWAYDQVGFGECCGRSGHTLEKGVRHMRFDLSLMAADLFGWQLQKNAADPATGDTSLISALSGWQLGQITPELQEHLRTEGDYWPLIGVSWILLPFGLIAGVRKHWTWLLALAALTLFAVHLAYWIGSQRYSTRYYFESLGVLALISALPLAWLARRRYLRWPFYIGLAALLLYTLYFYSTPRIQALYRFNRISPEMIEAVEQHQNDNQPILVLVSGDDVRWRAYGSLMAVTSPYLDSEIIVARNAGPTMQASLMEIFPERQIIEVEAQINDAWIKGEKPLIPTASG